MHRHTVRDHFLGLDIFLYHVRTFYFQCSSVHISHSRSFDLTVLTLTCVLPLRVLRDLINMLSVR